MVLRGTRRRLAAVLSRNPGAPAAHGLTVLPSDIFVVSYPRSGNTWVRFLIANALRPDAQATFSTVGQVVPDIYDVSDCDLLCLPRPRILKSHEPFDERYPRVVYIARNPADVGLSYYHYLVKMRVLTPGFDLEQFVERFIEGSLDEFGTWGRHVSGWLAAPADLVIRYEDMLANPAHALDQVLRLAGIEVERRDVASAVQRSSADELRRLERETGRALPTLRGSRFDDPFIRTGRAGAALEELPHELVARILEAWPETAARLGYA